MRMRIAICQALFHQDSIFRILVRVSILGFGPFWRHLTLQIEVSPPCISHFENDNVMLPKLFESYFFSHSLVRASQEVPLTPFSLELA